MFMGVVTGFVSNSPRPGGRNRSAFPINSPDRARSSPSGWPHLQDFCFLLSAFPVFHDLPSRFIHLTALTAVYGQPYGQGPQKTQCLCGPLRVYGSGDPSRCPWLPTIKCFSNVFPAWSNKLSEPNRNQPSLSGAIRKLNFFLPRS